MLLATMAREHGGQRRASPKFEQPSSTSTASLSTASLSTSTTKKSFNPQPTARKWLLGTHIVLSIATIRTNWDLSSINVESFVVEKGVYLCCLDSMTITSTVRRGGLSTSTMGSCGRVCRCCFSTANGKGITGYTLFLSNAF